MEINSENPLSPVTRATWELELSDGLRWNRLSGRIFSACLAGLEICSFTLRSFTQYRSNYWATVSDLLLWLFKKERQWANRSCCSLKKSAKSDSLFEKSEPLFHSLDHKKRAICSKKQKSEFSTLIISLSQCQWGGGGWLHCSQKILHFLLNIITVDLLKTSAHNDFWVHSPHCEEFFAGIFFFLECNHRNIFTVGGGFLLNKYF